MDNIKNQNSKSKEQNLIQNAKLFNLKPQKSKVKTTT
jgi:hypothetical protein